MLVVVQNQAKDYYIGQTGVGGTPRDTYPMVGVETELLVACFVHHDPIWKTGIGEHDMECLEIALTGEGDIRVVPVLVRRPFVAEAKVYEKLLDGLRSAPGLLDVSRVGLADKASMQFEVDDARLREVLR